MYVVIDQCVVRNDLFVMPLAKIFAFANGDRINSQLDFYISMKRSNFNPSISLMSHPIIPIIFNTYSII